MKKFIITAMCAAVAFCSIPFTACSDNTADSNSGLIDASESGGDTVIENLDNTENNSAQLTNLENYEVGDSLPVYPDCEFDYKVSDDCVVHISEIKAVLTAKNEISEGDLIEEKFYPYQITIYSEGSSNLSAATRVYLYVYLAPSGKGAYSGEAISDESGNLSWSFSIDVISDYFIYFQRIGL